MIKRFTKYGILMLSALFIGMNANAQISISPADTSLCPGENLTITASFTSQFDNITSDDYFGSLLNIGFDFTFYGQTFNQVVISANNYLSFVPTHANQPSSYVYTTGVTNGNLARAIMFPFQDINMGVANPGLINYQSFGNVGNRVFVVEFCETVLFSCNTPVIRETNQVVLYENGGIIEMFIKNRTTCSWQNGTGVQGLRFDNQQDLVPGRNVPNVGWNATNDGKRFTPNPAGGYTIDDIPYNPIGILSNVNVNDVLWYEEGNPNPIGQGASITVQIDPNVNYYEARLADVPCMGDGLDTITGMAIIHHPTYRDTTKVEICQGESYEYQGQKYYTPGEYVFENTSVMGCDSTHVLILDVNPLPNAEISGMRQYDVCQGDKVTFGLEDELTSNIYQWYKDGNPIPGETGANITVSSTGVYHAGIETSKGCKAITGTVIVNVHDMPDVTLTNNQRDVMCTFDTISLTATSTIPVEFYWEPDYAFRSVSGSYSETVQGVFPKGDELVTVRAFSPHGCSNTASVMVYAQPCCEVNIPTAFSPDNDGVNDKFGPILRPTQKVVNFTIFDKYGQIVHTSNSSSEHALYWDGNYPNGVPAKIDVYSYVLEYSCADGENYKLHGTVTLVK